MIAVSCTAIRSNGQYIEVPTQIQFGDMTLNITNDGRRKLQEEVEIITKSSAHFQRKVDLANQYFPIIERVFREYGIPDDIKYLVIQESALIPDAVSSSQAVGYWQFKDYTAMEVGLRVDQQVDERMSITASSIGAARYMKKNNLFFNNWLYAVQAYQMGPGGAMKVLDKKYYGAKKMDINANTYWYVLKFLAHKIAYESAVGLAPPSIELYEYMDGTNMTLRDIARETGVSEEALEPYNKWLKRGKVPDDKTYAVIIPAAGPVDDRIVSRPDPAKTEKISWASPSVPEFDELNEAGSFPIIEKHRTYTDENPIYKINNKPAIIAQDGDRLTTLADRGTISMDKLLKYNEITTSHKVKSGDIYYLKNKKNKARVHYHVLQENETLWGVSQKYGVKLGQIKTKNRITEKKGPEVKPGLVLWMRFVRKEDIKPEYRNIESIGKPPVIKDKQAKIENPNTEINEVIEPEPAVAQVQPAKDGLKYAEENTEPPIALSDSITNLPPVEQPSETLSTIPAETEPFQFQKTEKWIVHEVRKGETLSSISRLYEVKVMDIVEWNNLKINEALSIGQKLRIQSWEPNTTIIPEQENKNSQDTVIYYTVQKGEGLFKISRDFEVTIKELMEWNDKEDFELKEGEILKIIKR